MDRNLWCGGGLRKFDGSNWTTYTKANSGLLGNYVHSIAVDKNNNIWLRYEDIVQGSWGNPPGLHKFNGSNWTNYTETNSGLLSGDVYRIAIDSNNNVWLGYANNADGLTKFNGSNWTTYTTSNSGLLYNDVRSITVDKNNNIWIGTTYGGLYNGVNKFDGTTWTNYTE